MIEKIRDLVTAGEGVFEIEHIDRHIDEITRDHKRLGDVKEALNILKKSGVEDVLHVNAKDGIIRIKSGDMIKLAASLKVDMEEKGEYTNGNVFVGDVRIHSLLKSSDVYTVKRESGAFVFGPGLRARDLVELIECITKANDKSVEHFFYNGDFETWFKSIGKIDLAKMFSRRKGRGLLGSPLKRTLSKLTLDYVKTRVKREIKDDIKKKILSAIENL